jgi:hypothetical protein
MQTIHSEEFFNNEIAFLVLQVGKINKLIESTQTNKDKIGVWQYTRHRQQFIDQINDLLTEYNLKISTAV